jgi:uncharacterized protein
VNLRRPDYDTLDFKFELKSLDDEGALEGYAAVFGNLDYDGDVIEPGAFTKTIKETGGQVPILYQHDRYEPIGVSTHLEQDRHGLKVKGQLNMDVQRARETRALLNQGAMQGLSIGYKTVKKVFKSGARHLQELGLKEFSPVRCELSEALNPPGDYRYWIRDIAVDGRSALVSSWDDDTEAWVVAFDVDENGDVEIAPFADWIAAQQVWVQADEPKAAVELMLAKAIAAGDALNSDRDLSAEKRSALSDTHKQLSALLETVEPAAATRQRKEAANDGIEPAAATRALDAIRNLRKVTES